MKSLKFSGIKLRRIGLAGVQLEFRDTAICVDVLDASPCDVALYTHNHPRHAPSLMPGIPVFSPFAGRIVSPGEVIELRQGVKVEAVDAYNLGYKGGPIHPKGSGVGFLLSFDDSTTVYHMGDTDLVEEALRLQNKAIGVLLVPVGGSGVMSPEEAAEAVKTLRPSIAIPVHEEDRSQLKIFKRLSQPYTQVVLLEAA
ncbi:MAG: MBL fold metallo-hydrolase [Infirmifilum sp.]